MGHGFFAEASPCCPSPVVGRFVIVAYVVGGALVYIWMLSASFRWARSRRWRRGAASERDG
jgi:hypothetical protein